jgi:hypothetical protein
VYDLCLAYLGPAVAQIRVSDIQELELDLIDKVRVVFLMKPESCFLSEMTSLTHCPYSVLTQSLLSYSSRQDLRLIKCQPLKITVLWSFWPLSLKSVSSSAINCHLLHKNKSNETENTIPMLNIVKIKINKMGTF